VLKINDQAADSLDDEVAQNHHRAHAFAPVGRTSGIVTLLTVRPRPQNGPCDLNPGVATFP
jgi:hypothetical protein